MVVQATPPPDHGNSSEDFEKWIRMATDNKINSQNSWDLALIDYFHDLSLLKDGDGINFQKASATLDGCVKIYSSRVDSAVTETGRLINGLATSKTRDDQQDQDDEDDEDEEDAELDPNGEPVKKVRRSKASTQRDTLVEFKAIQIKKMDLELYVDPIFKKALTDFDEGGSKSLLLNMLRVNEEQKVVFDTSTTGESPESKTVEEDDDEEDVLDVVEQSFAVMDIDEDEPIDSNDYNIHALGERYFAHSDFDSLAVCPSLKDLKAVLNQQTTSSEVLKGLESVPLYDFSNSKRDDYDYDISFGDAGGDYYDAELPLQEPITDSNDSKYPGNKTSIFFNDLEEEADDYGNTIRSLFHEDKTFNASTSHIVSAEKEAISIIPDEELLAYFDENQRKQWTGPDHWKVQRLKKTFNVQGVDEVPNEQSQESQPKPRKQKEHITIDFLSDDYPDEDIIFEESDNILLPKKDWISKTKNVLPNDMHFTTRNFINLFTKDRFINSTFNKVQNLDDIIDESFYAHNLTKQAALPELNNQNFFNDDADYGGGFDDYDDYEAPNEPTATQSVTGTQVTAKSFGSSQSPLNYSRVSKKVDIKLLKDNLWDTLNHERSSRKSLVPTIEADDQPDELKFSDVVVELSSKYDPRTKQDLSTSFCFICLLHLANENGFTISNNNDNSDLILQNFQQ